MNRCFSKDTNLKHICNRVQPPQVILCPRVYSSLIVLFSSRYQLSHVIKIKYVQLTLILIDSQNFNFLRVYYKSKFNKLLIEFLKIFISTLFYTIFGQLQTVLESLSLSQHFKAIFYSIPINSHIPINFLFLKVSFKLLLNLQCLFFES